MTEIVLPTATNEVAGLSGVGSKANDSTVDIFATQQIEELKDKFSGISGYREINGLNTRVSIRDFNPDKGGNFFIELMPDGLPGENNRQTPQTIFLNQIDGSPGEVFLTVLEGNEKNHRKIFAQPIPVDDIRITRQGEGYAIEININGEWRNPDQLAENPDSIKNNPLRP